MSNSPGAIYWQAHGMKMRNQKTKVVINSDETFTHHGGQLESLTQYSNFLLFRPSSFHNLLLFFVSPTWGASFSWLLPGLGSWEHAAPSTSSGQSHTRRQQSSKNVHQKYNASWGETRLKAQFWVEMGGVSKGSWNQGPPIGIHHSPRVSNVLGRMKEILLEDFRMIVLFVDGCFQIKSSRNNPTSLDFYKHNTTMG